MPKAKKTDQPGAGHNHVLTDQERADLQTYYEMKIRAQEKVAAVKKSEYDAEREEVNALFAKVKGDLRYTRKEFEGFLEDKSLSAAEFIAKESKRARLYSDGGMPVGTQLTLALGDTIDDQAVAQADGRRAYLRGDDRIPPTHVSPVMHQDWMIGFDDEMTKVAESMGRAEAILAARDAPAAEEPAEEAEPEVDLSPETIDAKARRVRRSEFMERGTSDGKVNQPAAA